MEEPQTVGKAKGSTGRPNPLALLGWRRSALGCQGLIELAGEQVGLLVGDLQLAAEQDCESAHAEVLKFDALNGGGVADGGRK